MLSVCLSVRPSIHPANQPTNHKEGITKILLTKMFWPRMILDKWWLVILTVSLFVCETVVEKSKQIRATAQKPTEAYKTRGSNKTINCWCFFVFFFESVWAVWTSGVFSVSDHSSGSTHPFHSFNAHSPEVCKLPYTDVLVFNELCERSGAPQLFLESLTFSLPRWLLFVCYTLTPLPLSLIYPLISHSLFNYPSLCITLSYV